ncbi:MAG: phosphatidylserine/phosphatidylglycerophosphate/cardiolipin synthase family protein [Nannocystis sp.]|nr:phosphatidylserine/phosphatidylglycerophosphate/cardiolipin synthase family protein [Nannocystis sp.]MBA3549642.1 phosphatidylserine/phosphatidylglycerophosphate/cardiolipin synthase family protein [Nannocystis sp.]
MLAARPLAPPTREDAALRFLAQQTFSRVAGAPSIGGNAVELLIDGRANFDAWLAAIRRARVSILFENYIFDDDELGREFCAALAERAAAGVCVRVIRDWMGCLGRSRDGVWRGVRAAGGEVRTYNPPSLTSPLGWVSRDHRKLLVVDSDVGFVSGVCVSAKWLGDPARGVTAWRDTGLAVRGPAVRELAVAFAEIWARLGEALPAELPVLNQIPPVAGDAALRVVATLPSTAGLYRLEQMIAALAQETLWLTDAYFIGTAPYVQALAAAARDGVDVRLLVPGTSDLPVVGALSRAGYRSLLEAGVRVYEWNGSMLHAKTAVADGRWARVGSSNLNIASWMGNCELDVAIEDEQIAARMQAQYVEDLRGATEVVLRTHRRNVDRAKGPRTGAGSGRAAAGALRLANTVGAAITDRRELGASEAGILLGGAAVLFGSAAVALYWPRVLAWPLGVLALWSALSLIARYVAVVRQGRSRRRTALVKP